MIVKSFLPSSGKILGLIIIFALIATYAFVPIVTNPQSCTAGCTVEIGYPSKFLFLEMGTQTQSFMNYNVVNFIIDLAVFYFALCLLSLVMNLGRRKNVPNSNSGGRSSSTADKIRV